MKRNAARPVRPSSVPGASAMSRSGAMSSRIQNPRPWVATTRSSFLTIRSLTDVCGRFTAIECHDAPSSNEA